MRLNYTSAVYKAGNEGSPRSNGRRPDVTQTGLRGRAAADRKKNRGKVVKYPRRLLGVRGYYQDGHYMQQKYDANWASHP